ncbi:MAG: ATP-grasp domain-containing protein [Gammaproteobacteria bacterium]|nr:ATP-grasp domain-containing protein [Gammaproteobacteria bacterium]
MKRVLVLDACQRSALAVTRSLGKRGVPVITADETPTSLAGSSRFSIKYITHHSAQLKPGEFIGDIIEICNDYSIDFIFPMTELTTNLLLRHHSDFPGITLPFPELDIVEMVSDKCSLCRIANSLQIPIPQTQYVDHTTSFADIHNLSIFPVVMKPGKSWVEYNGEWLHTSVRFATSGDDVKKILDTDEAFSAHSYLFQEKVPGFGQGIFAIYDRGRPITFFAHRRIKEKPPGGGVSVLSESVEVNPVLLQHARSLLDHVHWHGIAMVEFKCNNQENCYLMEINTRFWGSLQLAIDAGVDFPWLLYQMTCGTPLPTDISYKKGTRLRWLLGDLDRLYLILKSREFSLKAKLLACLSFVKPRPFSTHHETNRWGDMRPFWWELNVYVKNILK